MEQRISKILKKYFGFNTFRSNQKNIITDSAVLGRDVYVSMATGAGKSLCFQVPPLVLRKTAIIISPLISIMEDQLLKLSALGIKVCHYSGGTKEGSELHQRVVGGYYRLIYMSPEKAMNSFDVIYELYESNSLCLFGIDEAHCLSQWGHDFRPKFRELSQLRQLCPDVPIMTLTATSTNDIQKDICNLLKLREPSIYSTSRNRPNIFYKTITKLSTDSNSSKTKDFKTMQKIIKQVTNSNNGNTISTIIYCPTINLTEQINFNLKSNGLNSQCYHSKLKPTERSQIHKDFINNKVDIVVATIAFGMGIDKPDIRLIIHYGAPRNLEEYYQESGRAGRDGLPSLSVVFFSRQDFVHNSYRVFGGGGSSSGTTSAIALQQQQSEVGSKSKLDKLNDVRHYLLNERQCRRSLLLGPLGEVYKAPNQVGGCEGCDNCMKIGEKPKPGLNLTVEVLTLLYAIMETNQKFGLATVVKFLRGSKMSKVSKFKSASTFNKGTYLSEKWWRELGEVLVQDGYLYEQAIGRFTIIKLADKGWSTIKQEYKSPTKTNNNSDSNNNNSINNLINSGLIIEISSTNGLLREYSSTKSLKRTEALMAAELKQSKNTNISQRAKPIIDISLISELLSRLIDFRKKLSLQLNIPPYMIFSEKALRGICHSKPLSLEQLNSVDGIDAKNSKDHGQAIISLVESFCKEKGILNSTDENGNGNTYVKGVSASISNGLDLRQVVEIIDVDGEDEDEAEVDDDNIAIEDEDEEKKSVLGEKRKALDEQNEFDEYETYDRDSIFYEEDIDNNLQSQLDQHIEKKHKSLSPDNLNENSLSTTDSTITTTTSSKTTDINNNTNTRPVKLLPLVYRQASAKITPLPETMDDDTYFINSFNGSIENPNTHRLLSVFKTTRDSIKSRSLKFK